MGLAVGLWANWVALTGLGAWAGAAVRDPSRLGFDFAFVAVFLALLVSLAQGKRFLAILPWGVAGLVAIAAHRLLAGNWYVLLGAISGALAGVVLRRAHA
jgi:predicted branched-subunit amino acid permease